MIQNLSIKEKISITRTRLEGPACDHTTQLELSLPSFYAIYIYKDKLLQHIYDKKWTDVCRHTFIQRKKKGKSNILTSNIYNNDTLLQLTGKKKTE